jgi:hypothetical protein
MRWHGRSRSLLLFGRKAVGPVVQCTHTHKGRLCSFLGREENWERPCPARREEKKKEILVREERMLRRAAERRSPLCNRDHGKVTHGKRQ